MVINLNDIQVMYEGQGHGSKVKVTMLQNLIFSKDFFKFLLRFDFEVKDHMGQCQRSHGLRSNKGSKQRQVGAQLQVASFAQCIKFTYI